MLTKIKHRHRLKNKETREIKNRLKNTYKEDILSEKSTIETGEIENTKIYMIDNSPYFFQHNSYLVFTLNGLNKYKPKHNYVVVDMGAIQFVTNGADVMAPGIVNADRKIQKDEPVWICDEKHHKPLATGIALIDGENMIKKRQGKAVNTIHYVGDKLWNLIAKSL